MKERKTLVVIPALNEEATIANVVRTVRRVVPAADIVVVNDGSTDKTGQVALESGAIVLDLPFNLGIGGGMQTGYLYAKQNGYQFAVQIDADGQHNAEDLPRLLQHAYDGEADMILGSRYISPTQYQASPMRRLGMIFLSWLVSRLTGQTLKDTTSGYRVINRRLIELFSHHYPSDYPEPEVLVYLRRNGYSVLEVPTEMNARAAGASSITPLRSIYYMTKVALALCMSALRYRGGV